MVVATAVLTAVAGGAFAGLRPDNGSDGRVRHGRFSGSADAPAEGDAPVAAGPTAPAAPGDPAGPGGAATAPTKGAPGTTGSGPGTTSAGDATPTSGPSTPGAGSNAPTTGGSTSPTTPGPGRGVPPPSSATAAPGWKLLPAAPIGGRAGHLTVWTGREMVVWGGTSDFEADPFTDGAAFDPATRTWRKVPAAPLLPRYDARAFWTGREMIVIGGMSLDGVLLGDGAAWDPATNRWRDLPDSPLGPRDSSVVAWAGDRLIVWGGSTVLPDDAPDDAEKMKNDGAAYIPATNKWVSVPAAPVVPRNGADSVWTGNRLVVTGGYHEGDDDDRTDGAAFDPISGVWSPIAVRPTPGSCGGGSACEGIWTGKVALFPVSGVAYDPAADRWSTITPAPVPDGPAPGEPAVWTGRQMLSWGIAGDESDDASGDATEGADEAPPVHGGIYDPAADRWQTFAAGPLLSRVLHTAIWTGQEMLVWGGTNGETFLADGASYRPE